MGKYSNINVNSLKNAVSTAIKELKQYDLKSVKNDLNAYNTLHTSVNKNINNSIDKVTSSNLTGSISNLKQKLENLRDAAGYIECYQETEREIRSLERQLSGSRSNSNRIQTRINSMKRSLRNYENLIDRYLS